MEVLNFLSKIFVFEGMSSEDIAKATRSVTPELVQYKKGEIIYAPDDFSKKIGFIHTGKCAVLRGRTVESGTPLNLLQQYDSFGITTLFSDCDEFPTIITAKTDCRVLFIKSEEMYHIIEDDRRVALNVIRFLTRRVKFLNDKVATFCGGTVEQKLANYILVKSKQCVTDEFCFNKKKASEAINCGRASLYRALDALYNEGYIKFDDKKIYIIDRNGLERMKK